jgi:cell division protein FtsW
MRWQNKSGGHPELGWLSAYDTWLMGCFAFLLGLGLVMVASASITVADRDFQEPLHYFWRQLLAASIGITLAVVAMRSPLHYWWRAGPLFLVAAIVLLVLVLIPGLGREVNGSMRWLRLGPISLQASEPVKLGVIVYLAGYLVRHNQQVKSTLIGLIKPAGLLTLIAGLLLLEPDYGVTVVLFATALGMLFMGGVAITRFALWAASAAVALGGIALLAPYRLERLLSFMDPWADPYDKGFQLTQALIAFGRGEWFGVGLGGSIQKLFYLPEAHTDFILAVLAEELGLMGTVLVIAAFGCLLWRAFAIGSRAEHAGELFAAYLAYGIGLLLGLQAFISIGVNMGVLPTKGLTLPLVSYGANSLVMTCLSFGLLLRIGYEIRFGEGERGYVR